MGFYSYHVNVSVAPCVPEGETGNLDCVTNSAWVSWLQAEGAESYFVLAVERGRANSSCSTTAQHCNVPDLLCGATYTFHVTAVNSFCHSGPSNTFQIQTGANTKKLSFYQTTTVNVPRSHQATLWNALAIPRQLPNSSQNTLATT